MENYLEPGVDGLGIYGSISPVTPRGGVSDTVRRQVPGTYSTRGFHMDLGTIITHLENFVDTWEDWNDVLEGLAGIGANPLSDLVELSSNADETSSALVETSSNIGLVTELAELSSVESEQG